MTAGGYVGIVAIYIYAFGWSFGWSVIPWVVPSEIFPNRIRALCLSSLYAFQWLLNFAITRGTPYMMLDMDKWGAYLLFSLFTFISVGTLIPIILAHLISRQNMLTIITPSSMDLFLLPRTQRTLYRKYGRSFQQVQFHYSQTRLSHGS